MGFDTQKYNVFSKNSILFLFVISAFIILVSTSCTRKVDGTSVLKLSVPSGFGSSKITNFQYSEPMSMQSVSTQSNDDDGMTWNPTLNPNTIAEVICYLVFVTGPENELRKNACVTTTGQNLLVGRWVGGIPTGGTLSLEVPSGPQREITIIGFKANAQACTNFKNVDMNGLGLSEPHVLGKVIQDLPPGTVNVTVPVTVNASTLKIKDCTGPDFNMNNGPLYFGDAVTGVTTVGASKSYSAMAGAFSSKVTGFDSAPVSPNQDYTFIETSLPTASLTVDSEVMIIVQGSRGNWIGTGNEEAGPCGYRAWEGRYAFARVMAVSSSPQGFYINKGTFMDKLEYNPTTLTMDSTQKASIIANLAATSDSVSDFCRIKTIKVLHFFDLTIDAGVTLSADNFGYENDLTGILPIRVSNTLNLQANAYISANSSGYSATPGYPGSGIGGTSYACTSTGSNTVTGGACSEDAISGAGGGGHGTPPGNPFTISGGIGGGSMGGIGGSGAGDDCGDGSCYGNLSHKIFMGGAGGSNSNPSASSGGIGGGIIYLMANNIKVAASGVAHIDSSGSNATSNTSLSGYGTGGGGAGGSIFLGYRNLDIPSGSNLVTEAAGGMGGASTVASSDGGGGGAGGRIHIVGCSASPSTVTKNAGGGMGGVSTNGASGQLGMDGSFVKNAVPCTN